MVLMLRLPSACARRTVLALLAAAAALPAARADGPCLDNETLSDPSVTHIDFGNATLATNTLHEAGGELRLDGVGIVRDTPVSLVVTDASPDRSYPDITDAWDARNLAYDNMNGIHGKLGKINLQTVRGDGDSGKGLFKFCLVDTATGAPTAAEKFVFTLYDIDERDYNAGGNPPVLERALFHAQTATAYQLWPSAAESDVEVGCEGGSTPPCGSDRTRFLSTVIGHGSDNPNDPNNLTSEQARRAVAITFENTDCFEFEYDIYCPVDTGEYPDPSKTKCSGAFRQGGNFLWGGTSERLVIEGECVPVVPLATLVPTGSPSESPTASPSSVPTGSPSENPSASQSSMPTNFPSMNPSAGASLEPSGAPTVSSSAVPSAHPSHMNLSAGPSLEPSGAPTHLPSDAPSLEPSEGSTFSPSAVPSAHPSHLPSDAPNTLTSCKRVGCCFDCFCCGPGTSWSSVAGTCVIDPSSSGCDEEADENVCYPGSECVAEYCCPDGTELVSNPNYPRADRCYCVPVAS